MRSGRGTEDLDSRLSAITGVEAIHPDDRERVAREWYETAHGGRDFASEYRSKTPRGNVTWLSGSALNSRP
jgi:hypothetical protein